MKILNNYDGKAIVPVKDIKKLKKQAIPNPVLEKFFQDYAFEVDGVKVVDYHNYKIIRKAFVVKFLDQSCEISSLLEESAICSVCGTTLLPDEECYIDYGSGEHLCKEHSYFLGEHYHKTLFGKEIPVSLVYQVISWDEGTNTIRQQPENYLLAHYSERCWQLEPDLAANPKFVSRLAVALLNFETKYSKDGLFVLSKVTPNSDFK